MRETHYATPFEQGESTVGGTHPADGEYRREERAKAARFVRGRGYSPEETAQLLDMLGLAVES